MMIGVIPHVKFEIPIPYSWHFANKFPYELVDQMFAVLFAAYLSAVILISHFVSKLIAIKNTINVDV